MQIYEPGEGDPVAPPDDAPVLNVDGTEMAAVPGPEERIVDDPAHLILPTTSIKMRKVYIDGVEARILAERVQYLDENGKLVTESLRDFTKQTLKKRFASLTDFLKRWKSEERKVAKRPAQLGTCRVRGSAFFLISPTMHLFGIYTSPILPVLVPSAWSHAPHWKSRAGRGGWTGSFP